MSIRNVTLYGQRGFSQERNFGKNRIVNHPQHDIDYRRTKMEHKVAVIDGCALITTGKDIKSLTRAANSAGFQIVAIGEIRGRE